MPPRRPAELAALPPPGTSWPLPLLTVAAGRPLYRLTGLRFPEPAFFGRRAVHRFDAPDRSFGVCYLGTSLACCLLEVFPPARQVEGGRRVIALDQVRAHYAAIATPVRRLRLAYLADDGLAQLGIDQRVTAGDDYDLSGAWAAALHAHAGGVDGIFYATRHHNGLYAVALFERAREAVRFERWGDLGDRHVPDLWVELTRLLQRFQIGLLTEKAGSDNA